MRYPVDRDLHKLDPVFRARVLLLLDRMYDLGHDAEVHEAWRSFERAAFLAGKGTGVAKSTHCYGLAVDIISDRNHWDAPPAFWADLGSLAEQLGLTWGGRFKSPRRPNGDKPHVQALPAALDEKVRHSTPEQIAEMVRARLQPIALPIPPEGGA